MVWNNVFKPHQTRAQKALPTWWGESSIRLELLITLHIREQRQLPCDALQAQLFSRFDRLASFRNLEIFLRLHR